MEKAATSMSSCSSSLKVQSEVQRSSEFIQYQDFLLQWPYIDYICSNARSTIQLKLFSTCQQLKNFIARARGCQVDAILLSSHKWYHQETETLDSHKLYFNKRNLVQLDLSYSKRRTIDFEPKFKTLNVDLNGMYVDFEEIIALLQKFDYSIAQEIDLWMYFDHPQQKLNIDVLRPMLFQTLTKLFLRPGIEGVNGDLLTMALIELPNLKKLRMGWQEGITNLSTAAAIPRTNKLEFFELRKINANLIAQTVFNFIDSHVSLKGVVQLGDDYGFACKCFHKKIRELLASSNVKFQLGRVCACRHE